MANEKKTLLEKYDIPVNHLEFDYIKKCEKEREMEKILNILYSGEEGYYPDLTKCAEDRLRQLNPDNKLLRREKQIITKDCVSKNDWEKDGKPVEDWSDEVKVKDNFLSIIANERGPDIEIPSIRGKNQRIGYTKEANKTIKENRKNENMNKEIEKENKRIKATDYRSWDKYDADTECLKMDLEEERNIEENEVERLKQQKEDKKRIQLITPVDPNEQILTKLTNVEKEALSLKHKDRGNDFFRGKEYNDALLEYTKALEIFPSAALYNNRAIAYIKTFQYNRAFDDLEKCLEIEPKNIKALLRKALTFLGMDRRRDAHSVYMHILSIEPSNVPARNGLNDLKKQLPDLAPKNATRITIKEEDEVEEIKTTKIETKHSEVERKSDVKNETLVKLESKQDLNNEFKEKDTKKDVNTKTKTNNFNDKTKPNILKNMQTNETKNSEANKIETVAEETTKQDKTKDSNEKLESQLFKNKPKEQSEFENKNLANKETTERTKTETKAVEKTTNNKEIIQKRESDKENKATAKNETKIIKKENENKTLKTEEKSTNKNVANKKPTKKPKPIDEDYFKGIDLAKLIIPKKIVKSKLSETYNLLRNMKTPPAKLSTQKSLENNESNSEIKIFPDRPNGNFLVKKR